MVSKAKPTFRVRELPKFKKNPFVEQEDFKPRRTKKAKISANKNEVVVNTETGATTGITYLHRIQEVDEDQFIKVYVKGLSAMYDLSQSAHRVLQYFMINLPANKADIILNMPDLMKFCGYNQRTQAYRHIGELARAGIMAKSEEVNGWFLNPAIIFNGDRIALINEIHKKPGHLHDSPSAGIARTSNDLKRYNPGELLLFDLTTLEAMKCPPIPNN